MKNWMLTICFTFFSLSAWGFPFPTVAGGKTNLDSLAVASGCDSTASKLPQKIDLKPYCPAVKNQGQLSSCVGWAVGYGALTIQRAIQRNCTDTRVITHNASSAMFLFNQIEKDGQGRGSKLTDAVAFLEAQGDCLARHFDSDVNDAQRLPDSALVCAAQSFAIAGFTELFSPKDADSVKVMSVKAALAQHRPVTIGLAVRRNFMLLRNALYWHPDLGDTTPAGGHAIVVIGYDEKRQAFQLMNSWGKDWGRGGFIWVKYEAFGKFAKYGCVLHLTEEQMCRFNME
ncbi:MAG: C1 family peptidase [Saprospiraceae bacterium]|nr:C1 family peptidase [Saprospiraceae bacterium]